MTSPMGRGSDTRLFNPRSESTRMFGSGEDDEVGHAHGEGDPEITAQQRKRNGMRKNKRNIVSDYIILKFNIKIYSICYQKMVKKYLKKEI